MTEILRGQAANVITVIRILLTYWMNRIIWSSGEEISFYLLFVFAVVIGATDWLDGKVARWLNIESEIGGHLDKLADKYYACSLFIYFLQKEIFSWNFDQITLSLINILIKAILINEAFLIVMWIIGFFKKMDTSPSEYGRWKMTFQFVAIAWLFAIKWLEVQGVNILLPTYLGLITLLVLAAVCGIIGSINYFQRYINGGKEA